MDAEIAPRPETVVVGLQIRTAPMSPDIPALWPRFVARIPEIAQPTAPHVSWGVMGHGANDGKTLDYLAGVAVHPGAAVPDGMTRVVVPAGLFALFRRPLNDLGFGEIFRTWLPASAFVLRPGPHFERYDEAFDPTRPDSLVEIGLPVAPR